MTLIEVSVTILVICVGTLATLGTYTHFSSATNKARERAVLVSVAQREMELLRPLTFDKLGLASNPAPLAATEAPLEGEAASEPYATGGVVDPGGQEFLYRGARMRVYRYVTKRSLDCGDLTTKVRGQLNTRFGASVNGDINTSVPNLCNTTGSAVSITKRITIIAVPIDDGGATGRGVRLTTIVQDPSTVTPAAVNAAGLALKRVTAQVAGTATPSTPPVTQTVSLTDTRCSNGSRGTPSSHTTRDTAQAGWTCGVSGAAPTLMTLSSALGTTGDPLPDFSTDVTRAASGGLAMLRDDRPGCGTASDNFVYTNAEAATRRFSMHQWASRPPSSGVLETPDSGGRASATLWMSTADGESHPGRVCIALRRSVTGAVIGSTELSLASFPSSPTELTAAFDLDHVALNASEVLVLTVRVPKNSGTDIRLLYDHAKYPSTLGVTLKSGKVLTS